MIGNADDDDAFAMANARTGLQMRVNWVHKLHDELKRLKEKHPQEAEQIDVVLAETKEWLPRRQL